MKRSLTFELSKVVVLSGAALLFGAPAVKAQINPQTAKGIAQSGAKAAQDANASAPQQAPAQKPATPAQKTVGAPQKPVVKKPAEHKSTAAATKPNTATDAQKTAKKNEATKAAVTTTQKPADKAEAKKAAASVEKPHSEEPEHVAYRRDPFSYLVGKSANNMGSTVVLPPGKAGLQVESLLIQGIVSSPEGMIAVVANPQQRVYFLREGDQLFDGSVMKIGLEAITFHEVGHDAFGKATEREVTKRLNNSSGELP